MGRFLLTRIGSEVCPADTRSRHITEVELHGADGFHRLPVDSVRLMLSSGDNIVAMSSRTNLETDVRKGKCACGASTIRSVDGTRRDDDLGAVPSLQ